MARTAVFIDLGFFIWRYRRLQMRPDQQLLAAEVADCLWQTARAHIQKADQLHRILVYDCRPLAARVHNPVSGKCVDFSSTPLFKFRTELHEQLMHKRKVALRFGELVSYSRWIICETAQGRSSKVNAGIAAQ